MSWVPGTLPAKPLVISGEVAAKVAADSRSGVLICSGMFGRKLTSPPSDVPPTLVWKLRPYRRMSSG
ncbi:hypothetical protein D3C80_2099280 [compost metagenome]